MALRIKKEIEINQQFEEALDFLENSRKNIFITGNAGTGKSTLLDLFRKTTKKNIVVLAPTGVAALNIKGQTIHSFFGFRPDINLSKVKSLGQKNKKRKVYEKIQIMVIDEISMVRADLLDCVDRFMRLNGKHRDRPFGGVKMVFIGDLFQLPPVVTNSDREIIKLSYKTPYFFSAHVFFTGFQMEFLELTKIYRQNNQSFIELLNKVRNNTVSEEDLDLLNSRLDQTSYVEDKGFNICLTTTNLLADTINQEKLVTLEKELITMNGSMTGTFDLKSLPTSKELTIKVGAQIMMLNNDSAGRWVNGSIGQVEKIKEVESTDSEGMKIKTTVIEVVLSEGKKVEVAPFTWEMYNYFYDDEKGIIDSSSSGSFTQYPMKLAWAITIHKSQGKTFDQVILDIGNGTFAHGQIYVALSRCTTFEGLTLKRPIKKRHIFMDEHVVKFVEKCRSLNDNGVVYEEDEYCDYSAMNLF